MSLVDPGVSCHLVLIKDPHKPEGSKCPWKIRVFLDDVMFLVDLCIPGESRFPGGSSCPSIWWSYGTLVLLRD